MIGQWPPDGTWVIGRTKGIPWSSPFLWEKGSCLYLGTWSKCSIFQPILSPAIEVLLLLGVCVLEFWFWICFVKTLKIENVFFSVKTCQCTRSCISVGKGPSLPMGRGVFLQLRVWHWGLLPRASQRSTISRWRQKNPHWLLLFRHFSQGNTSLGILLVPKRMVDIWI